MSLDLPPGSTSSTISHDAPLVAIDLLVEDETGLLLFERCRHGWLVPSGPILKGETLDQAFARLCLSRLGLFDQLRANAEFLGIHEHFYADDTLQEPAAGTHLLALVYRLRVDSTKLNPPSIRDDRYRWLSLADATSDNKIRTPIQAYLSDLSVTSRSGPHSPDRVILDAIRSELTKPLQPSLSFELSSPVVSWRNMPSAWLRRLTIAAALLLLLALFVGGTHPAAGSLFVPPWDKAAHASMYFSLFLLFQAGFVGNSWRFALLVITIGAADEIHQISLPARHAGWDDFAADCFGVLLGLVFRRALPSNG